MTCIGVKLSLFSSTPFSLFSCTADKNIISAPKIKVIFGYFFFQYWNSNTELFFIPSCIIIAFDFICFIFRISSLFVI